MAKSSIKDVFETNHFDYSVLSKSKTWFEQQSLLLAGKSIDPQKVIQSKSVKLKNTIVPGNLYMFHYDPIGKDVLPYYDRFPLVFPWKRSREGFIGLNLHYLPYSLRMKLMDKLLQFKTDSRMTEKTRIQFSWSLISGFTKFDSAKPCIKQYTNSNVKSAFAKINPIDWPTAMMLPVERFVGASKQYVWQESIKKI